MKVLTEQFDGWKNKLGYLSHVDRELAKSLKLDVRLKKLSKIIVPKLADWCAIDLVVQDGGVERVVAFHSDPVKMKLAKKLEFKQTRNNDLEKGVADVIRTGKPELYSNVGANFLRKSIKNNKILDIVKKLGLRSVAIVPLLARDKVLGAMSLVLSDSGREYAEEDLNFFSEVASQAAVQIDNVLLIEELKQENERIKKYEEIVSENEVRFRSIFNNALDGMIITDEKTKIMEVNPAACEILGMRRGALRRRRFSDFGEPELDEVEAGRKWKSFKKEGSLKGEILVNLAGGIVKTIEYSGTFGFIKGRCLFVVRDITERKLEEKRKDDFLGIASHEMKTPLAVIKAFAQVLGSGYKKWDEEKVKQYLSKITDNADRLAKIIYDLLDITRIREGRLEFYDEEFRVDELMAEVVGDFRQLMPDRKIGIRGKSNSVVFGDRSRIGQALTNLIKNAVHYSLADKKILVGLKSGRKYVELSVRDFGVGISAQDRGKIFDLFYRSTRVDKSKTSGLGVGLYISGRIISHYGGFISVKSKEGRGSIFSIKLPRYNPKVGKKGKNLLIVDDDHELLESMKLMFEERGYSTETRSDGKFVEEIEKIAPGLILLDYQLPGENGDLIAKRLKSLEVAKDIPIVIISANHEIKSKVSDWGVNDFIEKPFDMDRLLVVVSKYIKASP